MNILDWIIIGIMLFLLVRGAFRGFFIEIASLSGVVLGIWFANVFQTDVTGILKQFLPVGRYLALVSFAGIFIVVFFSCNLIAWLLKTLTAKPPLSFMDRSFGACMAITKGIVIIYFAIIIMTFYMPSRSPLIAESKLAPLIIKSYQSIVAIISPGYYDKLKRKFIGTGKEIKKIITSDQ